MLQVLMHRQLDSNLLTLADISERCSKNLRRRTVSACMLLQVVSLSQQMLERDLECVKGTEATARAEAASETKG